MFGGFWTPSRDKKQPLKPGEVQIGDVTARHWATHNQLINAAQFGATLRQVSDKKLKKTDVEGPGLSAGAQAAMWGLVESAPYVREMSDFVKAGDPRQAGGFWSEKLKSYLIPQAVSQTAEALDMGPDMRTVKRKPTGPWQTLETGIPGLRQNVPPAKVSR
jgi:hypothetical protein